LETDLEPGLPLVYCALDEINQVLLNMIINAAQAIREAQKNKLIKRGKIEIATRNKGDHIKILVRDNGAGIPGTVIDRIFEPFFTTKEVGKGTGQGLAIAHDIIATKHKGNIQVSSEEGKGTVFTICLPVKAGYNAG
ncbi:MAG: histidine kinase, partial [Firmicutes bacterium]|nr:histidine kinase [Bacillota bacterium]